MVIVMLNWLRGRGTYQELVEINRKLDAILLAVTKEGKTIMAQAQTLQDLQNAVAANTSVVASATTALTGLVQNVATLTAELQAAQAAGDDDAIEAAVAALVANNQAMQAAIPQIANAVVTNTPAAS